MTYAIECQGVSKLYRRGNRKVAAVSNLNLQIDTRQVYGFLGPNGAGKTTSIRLLLNLIRPTEGKIRLLGQPLQNNPAALKSVGALVEGANFYPYLSAWDNLRVLAWTGGNWDESRAKEVLKAVDLSERAQDKVGKFSTGMKQRLGIAAALLHNPPLVILDEPTNGLDPAAIHAMRTLIRQLVDEQGKTVFISSHLLSEVQQMCDRVAIIQQGQLLAEGRVTDLLEKANNDQLLVEVEPLETAETLLQTKWQVTQTPDLPNVLTLHHIRRDEIPQVVRLLVAHNIHLYNMRHKPVSLEDFFLSVTGGQVGN